MSHRRGGTEQSRSALTRKKPSDSRSKGTLAKLPMLTIPVSVDNSVELYVNQSCETYMSEIHTYTLYGNHTDSSFSVSVRIGRVGLELAFFEGNVGSITITGVNLRGPVDPVFSELFFPVGQPTGDAGDSEDGGKQIARNP